MKLGVELMSWGVCARLIFDLKNFDELESVLRNFDELVGGEIEKEARDLVDESLLWCHVWRITKRIRVYGENFGEFSPVIAN